MSQSSDYLNQPAIPDELVEEDFDFSFISSESSSFVQSISPFDLPSPTLTSQSTKTTSSTNPPKNWVWKYAEKRKVNGVTKAFCKFPRCPVSKTGYSATRGATTNIRNHLINDHKLNEDSVSFQPGT
ncbi:hypothetical protein BGZ46_001108, partial [Entomortierella lignicola]